MESLEILLEDLHMFPHLAREEHNPKALLLEVRNTYCTKHLITGPKGNISFCFPEAQPRETLVAVTLAFCPR